LIQRKVQGFLKGEKTSSEYIVIPGLIILAAEDLILAYANVIHPAAILSLTPLLVIWIYLSRNQVDDKSSRVRVIRRIGFQQTGNMIVFILILSIVMWL
jgi:hypothetical protein